MKYKPILVLILFFTNIICYCQGNATIGRIDFSLVESKLIITFDITNYKKTDKFNITPEIFKASGDKINAISFTGDLKEVTGGPGKKIIWDIQKDNIIIDDEVYVVITGEIVGEAVMDKPEETQKITQSDIKQNKLKPVSRTACFFESLIFPGWGSSRLTLKKGHLVKGFLGYGVVIGSILMANSANNSYDMYNSATSSTDRDKYYNEAKKSNTISKVFAGGAAAIWSIDLITVLAVKNKTVGNPSAGISIKVGYRLAVENTHQFTCKINF